MFIYTIQKHSIKNKNPKISACVFKTICLYTATQQNSVNQPWNDSSQ